MTKPVALSDQTYRRLKQLKRPGESFSQTIERLIRGQRKDPLVFAQDVPRSRIPPRDRLKEVERIREDSWEEA